MKRAVVKIRRILWPLALVLLIGCAPQPNEETPGCPDDTQWTFVVIGDTRSNPDIFTTHVNNILALSPTPELVLHSGDIVSQWDLDLEWKLFHDITRPLRDQMPLYPAAGNHDVSEADPEHKIFRGELGIKGPIYYSFVHHSVLFIVLSPYEQGEEGRIGGEQLTWLKQTLAAAPTSRIVILLHYFFPQGHYRGENVKNAEELHQLFVQSNVDVVFTGHEHQFLFHQRDGIAYVISGGGGAPLYHEGGGDFYHFVRACCEPEQIELQVITLDRSIVARYHIPFK